MIRLREVVRVLTVHEVSQKTGVSIRALHHYDAIGLLRPTQVTEAGYRLYDDTALERLQQILLFRELQFPLKEIAEIIDSPDFDRKTALDQQIRLLELRKERLENLIAFARNCRKTGVNDMSFNAFDTSRIDEYAEEAKKKWGHTEAYGEYEQKAKGRGKEQEKEIAEGLLKVIAGFQALKSEPVVAPAVRNQVKQLQEYISANYYTCTNEILRGLGQAYGAGGRMTENIDRYGGEGTAAYASRAIEAYCAE